MVGLVKVEGHRNEVGITAYLWVEEPRPPHVRGGNPAPSATTARLPRKYVGREGHHRVRAEGQPAMGRVGV